MEWTLADAIMTSETEKPILQIFFDNLCPVSSDLVKTPLTKLEIAW
jgi:hypothetical protein